MERNGSTAEAHLVRIVINLHKAVDGRDLDEATRLQYVEDMINWFLQEWFPGYQKDSPT